jgi:Phytanoyl-CoA dioxygenase (PhyH)
VSSTVHGREATEAEFRAACYAILLRKTRSHVLDANYWRGLNPDLSISEFPCDGSPAPLVFDSGDRERYVRNIHGEGYLQTPPVLDANLLARLRAGIERVVRAGYPSVFACVYDEFYQLFAGLGGLLEPILGRRYLMVTEGFWAFFVGVGDSGYGGWSATAPHRDSIGPDPAVLEGRLPTILNVWIPLTDATPLNSCIYVVPGHLDERYRTTERRVHLGEIRLQDIRALPAPAGAVLAWTSHLVHWGSRSSSQAAAPRMSAAMYFQNRDVPPYDESAMDFPERVPFELRLHWIARTMRPGVFDYARPISAVSARSSSRAETLD